MAFIPPSIWKTETTTPMKIRDIVAALATSVDAALAYVTQSSSTSAGFTLAPGWDLHLYTFRRLGGIAQYHIVVTRTGGTITVNTKGDIPNTPIGSIIPAQRPIASVQLSANSTGRGTFGGIWTSGGVDLAAVAGSANIVNGDQIELVGIGLLG